MKILFATAAVLLLAGAAFVWPVLWWWYLAIIVAPLIYGLLKFLRHPRYYLSLLWAFFKAWAASVKFYWATLKENASLGLETNSALTDMAIRLTRTHYEFLQRLYGNKLPFMRDGQNPTYDEYERNPTRYLRPHYTHVKSDGMVYVGHPWFRYRTVRSWQLTDGHAQAAASTMHTIPMSVQTTRLGMIPPDDTEVGEDERGALTAFRETLQKAFDGTGPKLRPDQEWMLMVLDVPETADGYPIPTEAELDWLAGDPMPLFTTAPKIGKMMLSIVNAAIRRAMKELNALEVTGDTEETKTAMSAIQSTLEAKVFECLGFDATGSIEDLTPYLDPQNAKYPTPIGTLARYGFVMLRLRISDIRLPKTLKEKLQEPIQARADMGRDLIKAKARVAVAEQDKTRRKLEGEGEEAFNTAAARGQRALLVALSDDGKTVTAGTRETRVALRNADAWEAGVSKARSSVVGGPNQSLSGLAAIGGGFGNMPAPTGGKSDGGGKDKKGKGSGKEPDQKQGPDSSGAEPSGEDD